MVDKPTTGRFLLWDTMTRHGTIKQHTGKMAIIGTGVASPKTMPTNMAPNLHSITRAKCLSINRAKKVGTFIAYAAKSLIYLCTKMAHLMHQNNLLHQNSAIKLIKE